MERDYSEISISRQCELLGVPRWAFYYQARRMSPLNLELMRAIDEIYTRMPFYGAPRIAATLKQMGYAINHKRVERLMGIMGLQAVRPKRKSAWGPWHL